MILDKLDKLILHELETNSKIPLSQLSKKIQKNRETITYRINKLEKNKKQNKETIERLSNQVKLLKKSL